MNEILFRFKHCWNRVYTGVAGQGLEVFKTTCIVFNLHYDLQVHVFFPGHLIHHVRMGSNIKECVHQIPSLILDATIQPITRTVLRVKLSITPDFRWHDKVHGTSTEAFWIWVEDPEDNQIHHSEYFLMHRKQVKGVLFHRDKNYGTCILLLTLELWKVYFFPFEVVGPVSEPQL